MKPTCRLRLLLLLLLAGILAACTPRSAYPTRGALPPEPTTPPPAPTATPTPEPVSPYPEYRLTLTLDVAQRRLAGTAQVEVPNHTGVDLHEIVFRLYPNLPQYGGRMLVGPVRVDGQQAAPSLRADDTSLAIPLERPLAPETSVTVELAFDVEIPDKDSGYVLFGHSQGVWSVPDAYPLLAVHDGSIWHEEIAPAHSDAVFADAALYDVTLTLPPTLTLAATGSAVSDQMVAEGQRAYRITGGPWREFAWLASADYQVVAMEVSGTLVSSYYLSGDEAAGQEALDFAAAALPVYGGAFGPYPYPEMAVVEAPLLYYGMEFPSLNLIGLDLYRGQNAQLEDRVVHEVAHQWWYAQVGNDQVNSPWLDEGLAEYSMAIYYAQVFGEERADSLVNQRWQVAYEVAVQNNYDAVVNQPSSAFSWDYEVFVYAKAALFFNALRQELGDETFRAVLQAYAEQYRWKIATPDDFLQVAESVSGRELDDLYNRWILSKQ